MDISSLHFLVAEDHQLQRCLLVEMLRGMGAVEILEAGDGMAALNCCQTASRPIDVVFSDLSMPGMDGLQFVRHLSEMRFAGSLILTSAQQPSLISSAAAMAEAYGITVAGVLEKPLLSATVGALLERVQSIGTRARRATPRAIGYDEIYEGLESGQFTAYYQPKVDTLSGEWLGVEALARWNHPTLGVILPDAFIPQMEASQLVDRLTVEMFGHTTAFAAQCRDEGMDLTCSLNLSAASVRRHGFAEQLTAMAHALSLDTSRLIFELTETASMTSIGKVLENLARLRMSGFGLAIDDFGTGYSSIQQLTRISFTELKIDRSFVTNAAKRESGPVILEATIALAKKLNITSVAEGVETAEDIQLLRQLHCDCSQGYYFAEPMDATSCLDWMAGRKVARMKG
jgi:EAL domain-containing protein (putative c-di-GMP-specific phosphodiesterase class I)/CheY-like chemotaxis protein